MDYVNGTSKTVYFLVFPNGSRVELVVDAGTRFNLTRGVNYVGNPNAPVYVMGYFVDGRFRALEVYDA